MKYLPLIWSGLWRWRLRTAMTFLSAIVAFFLFGMLKGVDGSIRQLVAAAHIDRLISGNPALLPLPLAYLPQIEQVPGVTAVTYANAAIGSYQRPANRVFVYAIDPVRYFAVYPETVASRSDSDGLQRNPAGVLVSLSAARMFGWKRGDRIMIHIASLPREAGGMDWPMVVAGFCDYTTSPDTPIILMNYTYLDAARLSGKGTVQRLIVSIRNPGQAGAISNAIDTLFANSPAATHTETEKDFAQAQLSQIGDIGFFVDAIMSAVFFALLLLVGNSLLRSFRERRREFAVLKALGFSHGKVAAIAIGEAMALCGLSAVAGLGLARVMLPLLGRVTGGLLPALMPPSVLFAGAVAAMLVAVASGAIPAWRAQRLSIVDALSMH